MAMEKNSSCVAMALMCGLVICCAVMYLTADGAESIHEIKAAEAVYGIGGPTSVETEDVEKAGEVWTNTPDGRMLLSDYLANVEAEIAAEEAARVADVKAVREQMERNFAFNKAARSKMEKALLAKMAANAKKAKKDLETGMRFVQKKFAEAAELQNKRNNANIARSHKLRATIEKNRQDAKKNLADAVLTQQRAQAAVASKINARIDQTNEHVHANAAQIVTNAKKAKEDLDNAVAKFDTKVANARAEAAAGRSKLAKQLEEQDKSIKQWANNKLKKVMEQTAAQFRRVQEKMAEDRTHADLAVKGATTKLTASLNAFTALNDKRFKQTVSDIATAKAEAEARVKDAETQFKAGLLKLTSTVAEQTQKMNTRIDQLTTKVTNNKVAQSNLNNHVHAEMKRMIKLGNDRYAEHLKKDAELKALIDKNKQATDARLASMAAHYNEEIGAVRATMKKNRAHATHRLAQESAKLYSAIAKGEAAQIKTNGELAEQTRQASLDIAESLKEAKQDFADRLGALHTVVTDNDKKFEGKIDKLTGVVRANAVKNAKQRGILSDMMEANKKELTNAVRDAVKKGEDRMMQAETKLVNLNKETKAALNVKITAQISKLTQRANHQIENLRLNSKEARDEMRRELLMAVRSMADEAKQNLDTAKTDAEASFSDAFDKEHKAQDAAAADRAAIAQQVQLAKANSELEIEGAVDQMHKALLALKAQNRKAIKKSNTKVDAYAAAVKAEAEEVKTIMKNQMDTLTGEIEAQKSAATEAIKVANDASVAGFVQAETEVKEAFEKYEKLASQKHEDFAIKMADERKLSDDNLATAVTKINDEIAKQAALADTRFSHTVKDIKAARAEASADVQLARQEFATGLAEVTSKIKAMDTKLTMQIQTVSGVLAEHQVTQAIVNRHVTTEINRIDELMNTQKSASVRARGKIRALMDENKRIAHEEVESLKGIFTAKIQSIRSAAAHDSEAAKKDLTDATARMYESLSEAQTQQIYKNQESQTGINNYSADAQAAINTATNEFNNRLDILTETVALNQKNVEKGFEVLTGVVRDYKTAGETERELIRAQNAAMGADMQKAITTAIQQGEARAKGIEEKARQNLSTTKRSLLSLITTTVENKADEVFKVVQGNFPKIADNYMSLKAYAVTAEKQIQSYVGQGKGKNLSSLGDLLVNIAGMASVVPVKKEGLVPPDTPSLRTPFGGESIAVDAGVTKVKGLVMEYIEIVAGVRERWSMGLGKYLLFKLEASMKEKGVLQVDKIDEKSGNWVFLNGHAVGLSNKLNDFESLAVRMAHYEASLAKLTAVLSGKIVKPPKKHIDYVKGKAWKGD